ncbi:hypothetical protein PTKIN_Ptkin03bG0044100 [Pterospermum kingtungense]
MRRRREYISMAEISLKALVDKTNNRVIFVESNEEFVDVLFSFLAMPVGTIVRLTRNQQPAVRVGCMNNLYQSVENLETIHLRTEECKTMLLYPRNGADKYCKKLKLKIDDSNRQEYFYCENRDRCKLLSYYRTAICKCGGVMEYSASLGENTSKALDDRDRGVFVKGPNRLMVSDELRVIPPSTKASITLFSKLGIIDTSSIEEKTFNMDVNEALNLLSRSLISKQPLTEVLLGQNPVSELSKEDFEQVSFTKHRLETASNQDGTIYVKLMISKSKNRVCCAEAGEDFVDLLFSFLTVPLGFIAKEKQDDTSKGSINHLYDSIQGLDAGQYLKTKETTEMLVSPKLAPGFGYEGQPLDIKEYIQQPYYRYWDGYFGHRLRTSDNPGASSINDCEVFTVKDPKSHLKDSASSRGFVNGQAMFTITDDLLITPLSAIAALSVVRKLNVPFGDIEERLVCVGKEEALRLLWIAYCTSESALTNAFLLEEQAKEVEIS